MMMGQQDLEEEDRELLLEEGDGGSSGNGSGSGSCAESASGGEVFTLPFFAFF